MGGFYSDPRYGVSKTFAFAESVNTLSVSGTRAAAATLMTFTVMENVTVTDWNINIKTGCTAAFPALKIGYSLDGTGTFTAFGTALIGTQANDTIYDAAVTATNVNDGSDIIVQIAAGTAAATPVLDGVFVQYKEHFVA